MLVQSVRHTFMCILIAGLMLMRGVNAEELIPAPLDLGTKDVAAYVVVPEVSKLLDNVEGIVKQFAPPGQFQPGMLKVMLGSTLGDPTMANLGNKPLVAMVFKMPAGFNAQKSQPPSALFIPAKEAAPFDQAFQAMELVTAFDDGVLTVAKTPEALKKAVAAREIYNKISAAKFTNDLRLNVSVSSLMDTFGPMVQMGLGFAQMQALEKIANEPPPPGMDIKPETATLAVKMFFKGLNGMLTQMDALQMDVKARPEAVTTESLFVAKPGTTTAAFLTGGSMESTKKLDALVKKGLFMMSTNFDPKMMSASWKKIIDLIVADPEFAELTKNEIFNLVQDGLGAVGGESVASMNIDKNGGLEVSQAGTVADEKKYNQLKDKALAMLAPDGALTKLYSGTKMKMNNKIENSARQHKGADITRMTVNIDTKDLEPKQAEAIEAQKKMWSKPTEMTELKGVYASANNPEVLDGMIDKIASGEFSPNDFELKSVKEFGPGKQMYMDYDVFALLKSISANDPILGPVYGKITNTAPTLISVTMNNGKLLMQQQQPLAPIADFAKQMQKTMKAMNDGVPPPAPPEPNDNKF